MDFFKFIRVDFPTGIFALPPGILSILTQNISHVYNMPQQLDYRWSLNSVSKLRNAEYQTIAITIALHIQFRIPSRLTWGKMQINLRLSMQWTHDLHGTIFLLETITLLFLRLQKRVERSRAPFITSLWLIDSIGCARLVSQRQTGDRMVLITLDPNGRTS